MPLTVEGRKVLKEMVKRYGKKRAGKYFYGLINKGKGKGWEKGR